MRNLTYVLNRLLNGEQIHMLGNLAIILQRKERSATSCAKQEVVRTTALSSRSRKCNLRSVGNSDGNISACTVGANGRDEAVSSDSLCGTMSVHFSWADDCSYRGRGEGQSDVCTLPSCFAAHYDKELPYAVDQVDEVVELRMVREEWHRLDLDG